MDRLNLPADWARATREAALRTRLDGAQRCRGFATMYLAIALVVLTAFCGLAVDATVLFLVDAKLSAAVDAVTSEQIRAVAGTYFERDGIALAAVGRTDALIEAQGVLVC